VRIGRHLILFILNDGHHIFKSLIESFKLANSIALGIDNFELLLHLIFGTILVFLFYYFFEAA